MHYPRKPQDPDRKTPKRTTLIAYDIPTSLGVTNPHGQKFKFKVHVLQVCHSSQSLSRFSDQLALFRIKTLQKGHSQRHVCNWVCKPRIEACCTSKSHVVPSSCFLLYLPFLHALTNPSWLQVQFQSVPCQ